MRYYRRYTDNSNTLWHKRLKLTKEQPVVFWRMQEELTQTAILYFIEQVAPVHLQTGFFDDGIDAYLFQRVYEKTLRLQFWATVIANTRERRICNYIMHYRSLMSYFAMSTYSIKLNLYQRYDFTESCSLKFGDAIIQFQYWMYYISYKNY